MGKRGPTPKGEYADKRAVLSTRISAELRDALERAVKQNGHTLSREVEHRLRRTFNDGQAATEMFGGIQNCPTYADGRHRDDAERPRTTRRRLVERSRSLLEVMKTIHRLLWAIRPEGTVEQLNLEERNRPAEVAEAVWAMIHSADATIPIRVSAKQHRANLIKADLGEIAERPTYELTNYIPPPPAKRGKRK